MAAKGREKIQQSGLWDTEVSLPKHDAICMWAHENAELIARAVYPGEFDRDWNQHDVEPLAYGLPAEDYLRDLPLMLAKERRNPVAKVLWEVPLTEVDGRITRPLGFADLVVQIRMPRIVARWEDPQKYAGLSWDLKLHDGVPSIIVEAKAKLPTAGELIRQINHYRRGYRRNPFLVIAPDDALARLLSDQDIYFMRYPN